MPFKDLTEMTNIDLLDKYTVIQGDSFKILHLAGNYAFMILQLDEYRGVGPLHITTIENAREGLVDERKEV